MPLAWMYCANTDEMRPSSRTGGARADAYRERIAHLTGDMLRHRFRHAVIFEYKVEQIATLDEFQYEI